jgi:glycerol-3-phosphate O-acyltransferase
MTAWFINKVFKHIYEKVVVDEKYLTLLSKHDVRANGPLVFVPTHKSYMDFLIASYIFYAFKIRCPHVAAAEDFL